MSHYKRCCIKQNSPADSQAKNRVCSPNAASHIDCSKAPALCFVAGKSGGHIIPCLTLAARAKARDPELKILFFSTNSPLDISILQADNNKQLINTHVALPIANVALSAKKLYRAPKIAWQFLRSFCTSFSYLRKYKPQEVVSTGGYIAIPVIIAARLLRIPVTLYELNVQPGKAVKWLAPHVNRVRICFAKTAELLNTGSRAISCELVEYPVRFNRLSGDTQKIDAQEISPRDTSAGDKINKTKKTIFIIGGSQGSRFLNQAVIQALLADSEPMELHIIHQTGTADVELVQTAYQELGVDAQVFSYSDQIEEYYRAADLVISRAGAGGLFETLFFKKPCIIIPLEMAHDSHQLANAREMVRNYPEFFVLLRQGDLGRDPALLGQAIRKRL